MRVLSWLPAFAGTLALLAALSGCATKPLATVGPISGSAVVNIGAKPPAAIVTTLVQTCTPPDGLLKKHARLSKLTAKRLSPQDLLDIAIADAGAYNDLLADDSALIDWVVHDCQSANK